MSKKYKSNNQRMFLLSYFDKDKEYEFKEVNGFILEKHWDGNLKDFIVAVYTKDSWQVVSRARSEMEQQSFKWIR